MAQYWGPVDTANQNSNGMDFQPVPYEDEDRKFQINLNADGTFQSFRYGGASKYLNTIKAWASLFQIKHGNGAFVNTEVIRSIILITYEQFSC